jgi:hypothetical protein
MNFLGVSTGPQMTPAEKQLRPLLFDEAIHVLSTFEMNQIASLTFNDLMCDEIFEVVEKIISKPLDHTPLCIQKAVVITKHLMIYGQDKCINHAYGLFDYFKALTNFNTVLMTQQQGGALAFFQTIQGGGVDKGGPIRDASTEVVQLISNIPELQRIRNAKASQNSLVPIGDDKVAFITDEVRHHILKQKIAEQKRIQIKSNLAKAENGFGAGYNAKDGKSVVGAAHGIEEMIKMAKMQKQSFSDDAAAKPPGYKTEEERILEELQAEADAAKAAEAAASSNVDLLGDSVSGPQCSSKEVDLLDFGGASTSCAPTSSHSDDLLSVGMGMPSNLPINPDPFGLGQPVIASASSNPLAATTAPVDPFASICGTPFSQQSNTNGLNTMNMNVLASGMSTLGLGDGAVNQQSMAVPSGHDRFAALDELATTAPSEPPTLHTSSFDAAKTEANISGQTSSIFGGGLISFHSGGSLLAADPYTTFSSSSGLARGLTALSFSQPPPPVPPPAVPAIMVAPGSGHVAKSYGDPGDKAGEVDENPWVMGGAVGTGLQPVGPAPGAPPPPPPPPSF